MAAGHPEPGYAVWRAGVSAPAAAVTAGRKGLLLAQVRRDGHQLRLALSGARAALTAARAPAHRAGA
jgi:hypothetical protein